MTMMTTTMTMTGRLSHILSLVIVRGVFVVCLRPRTMRCIPRPHDDNDDVENNSTDKIDDDYASILWTTAFNLMAKTVVDNDDTP